MLLIIPLGGIGSRFKQKGYTLPKPLINVMGKQIIFWLLDNLNLNNIKHIVIPYNKEIVKYRFESLLKKTYPKYNFIFLPLQNNTEGAAETLLIALNHLSKLNIDDNPIISLDGDNFYLEDILSQWNGENCVYCFNDSSKEEVYSYVKLNNNKISDIVEKSKISNNACTGAYAFNSWKELKKYCQNIIDKKIKQKNEYYTSTVIKNMIEDDKEFIIKMVNIENYICLGTPLHVRLFCNNFPRINAQNHQQMLKTRRYCFDLDNTLVTFPKISGDYTTVEPIKKTIELVRYLKKLGHTIIIYTARRMRTHKGNLGKLMKDIAQITFNTLEEFDIPYDEIYFGKPNADFYIDDLAISSFSDLEKELGYYKSNIDPRNFNKVKTTSIQTFIKESNDLSGEIYWYNNIPNEIKDIFPILINYDKNNKWYEMEKVNGIPISRLFLSEELTIEQLDHILGSINRIHSCKINDNINIYLNYTSKLNNRYDKEYYSQFNNSEKIFNELFEYFTNYESENKGVKSIIHGDPVLTNILINQFGKIKLIDMRGKQGNISTLSGDALYDWAKIYQSLIGYDEILEDKEINNDYKKLLLSHFEKKYMEIYNKTDLTELKMITRLLLFTLLPLHNNEKCIKYYNLIQKI